MITLPLENPDVISAFLSTSTDSSILSYRARVVYLQLPRPAVTIISGDAGEKSKICDVPRRGIFPRRPLPVDSRKSPFNEHKIF